jgi:RHS repeat-associated protein
LREYVWLGWAGLGWEPVAVIEGGVIHFIRTDHIGRPVLATDSTGTVVWTASYDPFGTVQASTGTPTTIRFPGQWFQAESGLHQNWMRDYDPTTGRYIQADPLGLVDGASVYGYAGQNPGRYVDPRGEFIPAWAAGAAAGAVVALLEELIRNDWQWNCVNWWVVGSGGAFGAIGGQWVSFSKHGAIGLHRYSRDYAVRKFRKAYGISGRETEVHHAIYAMGRHGANWRHSA